MHTPDLFSISFLQQIQRLKVFGVNEEAFALFIEMIKGADQPLLEFGTEELGIQHEMGILL